MDDILTQYERSQLATEVADFIEFNPVRLRTVIPQHHVRRLPLIQNHLNMEEYAYSVIKYCETSAWVEDPALIIQLLKKWKHLPIFDAAIRRLNSGVPPKYHIDPRPWDTMAVPLNLPFLNRKITRQAIEHFYYNLQPTQNPPGVRVLIVKGPPKSGKSLTELYIGYINTFMREFKIISIDLNNFAASHFGPLDLTRALLNEINSDWPDQVSLPELDTQQPSRWILQLCTVITEQITFINRKCLIILDGFNDLSEIDKSLETQQISRDTIEMIILLASIAAGSQLAEYSKDMVRLVLIGFKQPVTNFNNRVRVEDIQPLKAEDIKDYFIQYAKFYKKEVDPLSLDDLVNAVLEGDKPENLNRTQHLAQRALTIAKAIFNS